MSKIYVFENFNNYANRTSLMYQTINLYPKATYEATINFNPNDGANTSLVLMYKDNVLAAPVNIEPDYAIVCDNSDKIESRWYVTDSSRLSDSKFRIVLKRDIASDYKSEIMNSVAFVKRGWVNSSNPLIFNSENGNDSQILKERIDLKDKSGKGGYIAFLAPNFLQENIDKANFDIASNSSTTLKFNSPAETHAGNYKFCYGADPNDVTPKPVFMRNYNKWGFSGTSTGNHSVIYFTIGVKAPRDVNVYTNDKYAIVVWEDGTAGYDIIAQGTDAHGGTFPDFVLPEIEARLFLSDDDLHNISTVCAYALYTSMWDSDYIDEYVFSLTNEQNGDVPTMRFMAPRIESLASVAPADDVDRLDLA